MKRNLKRLLSFMLSVMMLVTMLPITALAAEWEDNLPVVDSGDAPKHWLQQYQEYVLEQIAAAGDIMPIAASGSPSYRMISWATGEENNLVFANGAYLGDGMPRITLNGQVAFCAQWNGEMPSGNYIQVGEGNDTTIKQILANYDNSGKSDADYAAAQAAIWAHIMGTSIDSWGACPGRSSANEILNGHSDYSNLKYNYIEWSGGLQDLITYNTDEIPTEPPDEPPDDPSDRFRTEVTTETSTTTEVRNQKTYEYSDALGQITIRKHDQDEKSLDGALFNIDVAFTDGSHITVNNWEVDNGARLFTWTHPENNHDPATVTVTEVQAPNGYVLDSRPQTAIVHPTYTRVTHVETWTVTIVTETTSSTTIDIDSGEVVSQSASSSTAETSSEPQVEEFADFIEGDRETTMTFVNQAMPCSLTIYKYETGNKGVALEGASFRIRYADPNVSAQTWTETTDANGEIHIDLPYAGALIVEELSAPAGYVMTTKTVYDVTVAKGEHKTLEISNDKKAQLIVTKKDAQSGQLLAGATIQATLLRSNTPPYESGQTFTATTGTDGKAVFSNLVPGEYRVEEISPPQYYQGTSEVHTINIPEGNSETVTLEFRNEPWTGLTIKKVDATDGHGLQGAVFKLYEGTAAENTKYLGDYQTNENGMVVIQKLESGKYYTVVEAQPPYGYFLDSENTTQTILIKPDALDGNITLIFRNEPKPKLFIEKVDAETGIRLPGASFRVARRGSSEYVDVTTGADGTVLLENMEADWYEVTELRAPTGYTAVDEHYDIELISGKTATLTVKNSQKPGLFIEKIDADTGVRLPGATFRISPRDSAEYQDVTIGSNGTALVEDLDPGFYEVYELRAPTGYVLNDTHYDVELVEGKTAEIIIKNGKKPGLFIEKIDADSGKRLPGAVFRVSNRSTGEFVDVTTEANGAVTVKDLEPGWYEVYELRAPTGYTADDTHYDVELIAGKTAELTIQNRKKPSLTIEKIDSMTLQPLEGVVFEIFIKDGKSLGQFSTNQDGKIILEDADPDLIYLVREVRALPGYLEDDTVYEFTLTSGENGVIKLQNTPEHPLIIMKKDAVTGEAIPDTVFLVTCSDGRLVGEYRTGPNGMATVTGIDPGWYLVREVKANPAYIANDDAKLVELKLGSPAVIEVYNKPRTGLQIRKVDDVTGEPLEGVQFKISEISGAVIGTYTTDEDGIINLSDREEGWVQVVETKGLDGYKPDPAPRNIELKSGQLNVLEYRNQPYPILKIVKLDAETRQPLEGVTVKVFDSLHREIGTYTTNKLGQILLSGIGGGETLYVQEVETLPGYELDETVHEVTLAWGQTSTVEILNREKATLRIVKIDAESGEPIYGVTFNLYDNRNNLLGEYTTDQDGVIEFSHELPAGKYKLKEIRADGYVVDSTIRTIEVKSGETTEIVIENQPIRGQIQIVKKAADYNDITKDKAGALLAGAVFEIFDANNNVVDTITTDDRGVATTKPLPVGVYGCREIQSPEFYILDDTVFYAAIKIHGDLVRFEVLNESEILEVGVTKYGNYEAMPGDTVRYDFENITNASSVELDDFYWRDEIPTDALRLGTIHTGTWNERLTYSVEYQTNTGKWRTLADGLSSQTNNELDCDPSDLHLKADEYITAFRFNFGTVQAGFREVDAPYITCTVNGDLPSGYRFINRTDAGGQRHGEWIIDTDTWVTVIFSSKTTKFPYTGR